MHESFASRSGLVMSLFFLLLGCDAGAPTDKAPAAPANTASIQRPVAAPPANEQVSGTPEIAVETESLPYAEIGEELIYGHFAFPSDMIEPLPAVVLIHDTWGLNDDVKAYANRLAAEGYMVLAVDLFQGSTTDDVVLARQHAVSVVENAEVTADNLRQALVFVGIAGAPRNATLGFGLGGGLALDTAQQRAEDVSAAIVYYGQVPVDDVRINAIDGPVLGLFGDQDRSVSVSSVTEFEAAMRRVGKDSEVEIFSGVGHGFAAESRQSYDADVAADAWQRVLEFLASNLPAD